MLEGGIGDGAFIADPIALFYQDSYLSLSSSRKSSSFFFFKRFKFGFDPSWTGFCVIYVILIVGFLGAGAGGGSSFSSYG